MIGRVKEHESREAVRETIDPAIEMYRRRTSPDCPPSMRSEANMALAVLQNIRVALIGELLPHDPRAY